MPPRKRGKTDNEAAVAPDEDVHDHMSALPDDALEHILSFIPAQDAVRTCVLARRWRSGATSGSPPKGLSTAKNLALVAPPDMFIFRRDLKHCPMFRHLKKLLLNECWCVPDVCALACILQHAPVLEKLTLQLFSKGPTHMVEIKGNPHPKVISAAISQELKIVEVKCEVVNETVLNVLKFLSKHNICFSFEE